MKNNYKKYNEVKIITPRVIKLPEKAPDVAVSDYRETVLEVSKILDGGGYNSISQIIGYILSDDPAHISNFCGARSRMSALDRDALLEEMVKFYIEKNSEN